MSGMRCIATYNVLRKLSTDHSTKGYAHFVKYNLSAHNLQTYRQLHKNVIQTASGSTATKLVDVEARQSKIDLSEGPDLADFIRSNVHLEPIEQAVDVPYLKPSNGSNRKVFFEVFGCQMNVNDTEVVWSILKRSGFQKTDDIHHADIVLLVTCAIRDGAEQRIWNKLSNLKSIKKGRSREKPTMKIGLLGCMAERLKYKLVEEDSMVDLVAGPDSYKDLPRLLALTENDQTAVNVILSLDETYADVMPVRLNQDSVTAFVSIMRGCDNMCTYCIVPFTRGRERSRPITSILDEIRHLSDQGVKEVTLLGQNVNSYRDVSKSEFYAGDRAETKLAQGFKTVYKSKLGGLRFSDLLDKVSLVDPEMRIRFTSPHPKDFPDEVLQLIAERPNICRNLHLPAQSGNSTVLERMRRGYTREAYLDLVERVRSILPNVSLSSDFISGFCGETEDEFEDTLSLMQIVKFNMAYTFAYSMREKTTAHRRYKDDVDPVVKKNRVQRMMSLFRTEAEKLNQAQIGQQQLILVEGRSKRSASNLQGRNDGNTKVIIPTGVVQESEHSNKLREIKSGDYVVVQINDANSQVLKGIPLYHSSITQHSEGQTHNAYV